jgi:uncharacterized protein (TIGR04255 family)
MIEDLGLPEPSRVVFEHPPLVLTLCQLRFSRVLEVNVQDYIEPFRRAIETDYPTFSTSKQVELMFNPELEDQKRVETLQWRFSDEDENWTAVLTQDFFTLETRRYARFEDFLSRFRFLLGALMAHVKPKVGVRLGLRYINEIRLAPRQLSSVVRQELLGLLSKPNFEKYAAQSFQEMLFNFSEAGSVSIRHGFLPDGSTVQPSPGKSPPTGPFYLLDFDMSRVFSAPSLLEMEPDIIIQHVDEYHNDIEKLFRWSITEEFAESLGAPSRVS